MGLHEITQPPFYLNMSYGYILWSKQSKRERNEMERNEVVVTDIQMTFGSMVVFMIKWAIAAIPALIILSILGSIVAGVLSAIVR